MKLMRPLLLLTVGIVMLAVFVYWHVPVRAKATTIHCGGWQVVQSANLVGQQDHLQSVSADSLTDAWAVGVDEASSTPPFIEHWNGTQWSIVATPQFTSDVQLDGVTALSSTNVWVVGDIKVNTPNPGTLETFIGHWNGTSWSTVASPSPGSLEFLYSVTAVSASDIWAVGNDFYNQRALIEHWNGKTWSVVSSPYTGLNYGELRSVKALSSTDVWAVGDSMKNEGGNLTLIEHWNGTKWSVVPSPNVGNSLGGQLYSVSPVSANDVWAVGYQQQSGSQTLTEHWNGKKWSVVSSPEVGQNSNYLTGVVTLATNNVWAVGYQVDNGSILLQWNGTAWHVVSSPDKNLFDSQLYAASIASTHAIWAVGSAVENGGDATLTDFYC